MGLAAPTTRLTPVVHPQDLNDSEPHGGHDPPCRGTTVACVTTMSKLITVALAMPLVACVTAADDAAMAPVLDGVSVSGHVAADATWTGTVNVVNQLTVDRGATLTIAAGTTVRIAEGASIVAQGTVNVQGTKASGVQISPTTATGHHNGFSIPSGGVLQMSYAIQVGGNLEVTGGRLTVTDSKMSRALGDLLVVNAGTVDMSYSQIGADEGSDSTHCDGHFGGGGITIKLAHSNLAKAAYGLMLYGGSAVDLTYDNWFGNAIDIDTSPGVMGDVTGSWFERGAPSAGAGAELLGLDSLASARVADAGPR